ncbi:cullin domain containing protein [Cryptosporidium felis]|nr:cullin domain containing protein [Cryptosporidium felis]
MQIASPEFAYGADEEFESEIEFFLARIYGLSDGEEALSTRVSSTKRIRLTNNGRSQGKINLERTRRLVIHLCNHGKYEFLYNTFKKNYFEIWTGNLQAIQRHQLLLAVIRPRTEKSKEVCPEKPILELVFGERAQMELLKDYLSAFTRFWCHHKRSTQVICNVYLYFDCTCRRFNPVIRGSETESYLGFVQNADSYLRTIILEELSDSEVGSKPKMPISVVGVLVSIFRVLNQVRDQFLRDETCCSLGRASVDKFDQSFFMARKMFEMLIRLGIANHELKELYSKILERYYLDLLETKKSLDFKKFVAFLKKSLDIEKTLLATLNNKKVLFGSEDSNWRLEVSFLSSVPRDPEGYRGRFGDGSKIGTLKLPFLGAQDESEQLEGEENVSTENSSSGPGWDLFVFQAELKVLDVLVSDELMQFYSKINNGRSCLAQLVTQEEFETLTFLFNIFLRKGKERLFRTEFEKCIVEEGLSIIDQLTGYINLNLENLGKDHNNNKIVSEAYLEKVRNLLELYIRIERIWRMSFLEDEKMRNLCINEAWVQILNFKDSAAKEIMRGFSLLIHHLLIGSYFFHDIVTQNQKDRILQKVLSRVNLEIMNWNINSSFEIKKGEGMTKEYIDSIIHLFKCSNFKEYFQKYYHQLLSQRLIFYFIPNRIGFGGNPKKKLEFYLDWVLKSVPGNNAEMLLNRVNVYEIYLMKLLYNECGYTFINRSNFVIKDWFSSESIFKFYLLELYGNQLLAQNSQDVENPDPYSLTKDKRLEKLQDSQITEKIHSWLKSEDLKIDHEIAISNHIEDESSDLVSNEISLELQNKQEKEELNKEEKLKEIRYEIPFSILVLSSSGWPLCSSTVIPPKTDSVQDPEDLKLQNPNFLNSELFSKFSEGNPEIKYIQDEIFLYQQFYTQIYSRTLTWSYYMGTCLIDFCISPSWRKRLKIVSTLQQAILLLCFNDLETKELKLSRTEYLKLRGNVCRLGRNSKIIVSREVVSGEGLEVLEFPSILKFTQDPEGGEEVTVEFNSCFEEEMARRIELGGLEEGMEFILDFTCSESGVDFGPDFSLDLICDLSEEYAGYLGAGGNGFGEEMATERREALGCGPLESPFESKRPFSVAMGVEDQGNGSHLRQVRSYINYVSLVIKNNKYKVEALIMKYLKHRQKSSLLSILEVVTKELFSDSVDSGDLESRSPQNGNTRAINEEVLKILNSLVQRDLIGIDPENDQFYNYIP